MRHDHVAVGAGLFVEGGARADRQRLGNVDPDVIDVIAIPDRFEDAVRESEREDVLHRLLAEEVVDPEDLRLVERGVQERVQRAGGGEIGAEGLLDDDPRARDEPGRDQRLDGLAEGDGRHGEVVESARVAAALRLGGAGGRGERVAVTRVRVEEVPREASPGMLVLDAAAELVDGTAGEDAEGVVVEVVERGADDPVARRQQAGLREAEEAWQELAPGEVAGRPEEDDEVVVGRPHAASRWRRTGSSAA